MPLSELQFDAERALALPADEGSKPRLLGLQGGEASLSALMRQVGSNQQAARSRQLFT
jgi:hypothetical protein